MLGRAVGIAAAFAAAGGLLLMLKRKDRGPMLTDNFAVSEFRSKDGHDVPAVYMANARAVAAQLEILRAAFGNVAITIVSGYRTPERNAAVDGAGKSQHLTANAADIRVRGYSPVQVKAKIEELIKAGRMKNGGIGLYATWVHYDLGPVRRWTDQ